MLAVKPQSMPQVLAELRPAGRRPSTWSSRSPRGSRSRRWPKGLGGGRRLVRVMPNTPALLGEGASAYCLGPRPRPRTRRVVRSCLESVGRAVPRPGVPARRRDRPVGERAGVRLPDDRGPLRRRRAGRPAARHRHGAGRPDRPRARRGWSWRPACIRACSRTRSPAPAARPSPACTPWSAAGVRAALIDAVEAATRRSAELAARGAPEK